MIIQAFIDFIFYCAAYFVLLMIGFAVLMTVWAWVEDTALAIPTKIVLGIPYWACNLLFNWTIMSIVFWPDTPLTWYEPTTNRLKRYRRTGTGRRKAFADWVCNWLNRWDPKHC